MRSRAPPPRQLSPALLAVLALLALSAPAAAQVFVEPGEVRLALAAGERGQATVTVTNPTERSYFVVASAPAGVPGASVDPRRASVGPGADVAFTLAVQAGDEAERRDLRGEVTFSFVDRATGEGFDRAVGLAAHVEPRPAFLGLFPGVLPPPLHAGWGLFAAEAATWALAGVLVVGAARALVPRLASLATPALRAQMAGRIGAPLWLAVFVVGLTQSWRLPPQGALVRALDRLNDVAAAVVVALVAYRLLGAALLYYSERAARGDRGQPAAVLVAVAEKLAMVAVVLFVATYALGALGVDLGFLLAGGLVVGLVLSFAAQDSLSNFFSGIFLLLDRPFRDGDEILLDTGERCRVDRIGFRTTRLFHYRHDQELIVPNNELATKRVVNMSYPDTTHRLLLRLAVAYGADLERARRVLLEVADGTEDVLRVPGREPTVWGREFQDSGIELELRVYIPSPRHRNPVRTALVFGIKAAFDREGIAFATPQREVHLHGAGPREQGAGPGAQRAGLAE